MEINKDKLCYFTFPTTYYALLGEKILKRNGMIFKMTPLPRSISSNCGTALRCSPADKDNVQEMLTAAGVIIESCHILEESKGVGLFSLLKR